MSAVTVHTQAELDAALAKHRDDPSAEIIIASPAGVWLEVNDTGRCYVSASGSATVSAWNLHSSRCTIEGGVLIDITKVNQEDADEWAEYTGAQRDGTDVLLYKAVDADLTAGHGYRPTKYPIGEVVECPDWRDNHSCGGGLHASPHPEQALAYAESATRMLLVAVDPADLRPIPSATDPAKAKAKRLRVIREVRLDGGDL